jgi:hypothetical protein
MRLSASYGVLLRLAAGTLGAFVAGWIAFRDQIFDLSNPAFQCIPIGALAAAILALVRTSRPVPAIRLVGAFALLQFGVAWSSGPWSAAITATWSVVLGLGMWLVASIFDQLARLNVRLGKFLIVGPLLGGVYFVATPLASLAAAQPGNVMKSLWWNGFLGIVIGDGVAAAVEVVELFIVPRSAAPAEIGDGRFESHS